MTIVERLRKPKSTSTSNMNTMNDAADYIEKLEAEVTDLRSKLSCCFKGETNAVRNELVINVLNERTEELLKLSKEDIREYLEKRYETYG